MAGLGLAMVLLASAVASNTNHPGRCYGGQWPEFYNQAELAANPWGQYFKRVYGDLPGDGAEGAYPWCVGDFWFFYDDILEDVNVTDIPDVIGVCPTENGTINGQRYTGDCKYWPSHTTWSWHATNTSNVKQPRRPFANHTWVEVMHKVEEKDETSGAWFFYAKGSGIWINLNESIHFLGHGAAQKFFNVNSSEKDPGHRPDEVMSRRAARAGYDSIQFLYGWPEFCGTALKGPINYELVSTRLVGATPCASEHGRSPLVRTGWLGANECTCSNNDTAKPKTPEFINCKEIKHGAGDGFFANAATPQPL